MTKIVSGMPSTLMHPAHGICARCHPGTRGDRRVILRTDTTSTLTQNATANASPPAVLPTAFSRPSLVLPRSSRQACFREYLKIAEVLPNAQRNAAQSVGMHSISPSIARLQARLPGGAWRTTALRSATAILRIPVVNSSLHSARDGVASPYQTRGRARVQNSNQRASGDIDAEVVYRVWNSPRSPRAARGRRVASEWDTAFRTSTRSPDLRRIRSARFSARRGRSAERGAFAWRFANSSPFELNSTYIDLTRQSRGESRDVSSELAHSVGRDVDRGMGRDCSCSATADAPANG